MSGERVERRLAAVLAADIAGYSRLMGRDEERAAGLERDTGFQQKYHGELKAAGLAK